MWPQGEQSNRRNSQKAKKCDFGLVGQIVMYKPSDEIFVFWTNEYRIVLYKLIWWKPLFWWSLVVLDKRGSITLDKRYFVLSPLVSANRLRVDSRLSRMGNFDQNRDFHQISLHNSIVIVMGRFFGWSHLPQSSMIISHSNLGWSSRRHSIMSLWTEHVVSEYSQ